MSDRTVTVDDYQRIFDAERAQEYPAIDALERRLGYAVKRYDLERAASVLACPLKVNPPCWQHGRVIYAVARRRLAALRSPVTMLDVGTAKGFSALCARWALMHSGRAGLVHSVDVIDPLSTEPRNSVVDLQGRHSLRQLLSPWPETDAVAFYRSSGVEWLLDVRSRVHFAFLDGKHSYEAVSNEIRLLSAKQEVGDVIVFDDLQIPGVARAVGGLPGTYELERVEARPERAYGIAWRTR